MSSHHYHYSKEEGHSGCEERVEILQTEVEKKNRMLLEVKKHLREAAEREKQLKTISHDSQVGIMCVLWWTTWQLHGVAIFRLYKPLDCLLICMR